MTKQKNNNLFVYGKRAALLAMFAALPFSGIKAINEQNSVPQTEEIEQNTTKPRRDTRGLWAFTGLMLTFCIPWWTYMMIDSRKHPEKWRGLERGI